MCIKAIITTIIYLVTSSYASVNLAAEKETPVKRDTFRISLGVTVDTFDSEIRLTSAAFPDGIGINFEDDLDFDDQTNFGWIGGYWRFANRHRIRFSFLPFDRSAKHTLDTDIQINDEIIKIGAFVKAEFKTSVYDVNYMYSVYQSPDLEIALTGGIYFMHTEFDLEAAGTIAPVDGSDPGSFQGNFSDTEKINAPLPLFGFKLQYQITPRWNLNLGARYLHVEIDDFDGSVTTLALGTDYFLSDKFGVGVSLGWFDSEVDEDETDFSKELSLAYKGLQVYLVYRH